MKAEQEEFITLQNCRCEKNPVTEYFHSCPFASDVENNDDPEHCNCCDECQEQCAMDI